MSSKSNGTNNEKSVHQCINFLYKNLEACFGWNGLAIVSQRENPCLPCVKIFAVRFISGAWQRACLPCVFYIAHGKKNARLFAVRLEKTHGKDLVYRAFLL
jgi:hypothetical protein